MEMIYNYILTLFEVIVRLVTEKTLMMISFISVGFLVLWIVLQLLFSFQRKFSTKCIKLYNFIKKNNNYANNLEIIDKRISNISAGFSRGWKKFRENNKRKPSDYITRYEALDVEVHGGILNQGKSLMKSYIRVVTAVVFLLNIAFLGGSNEITFNLIAQTLLLPAVTFLVLKIFYYTYTSIRHSMYKSDVDWFYELINLLDETFGKDEPEYVQKVVYEQEENSNEKNNEAENSPEEISLNDSQEEDSKSEESTENQDSEESVQEEPVNVKKSIDDFDIFKKKNIDVDKLINEIPNSASSLPYINVDSDYVIKDDEKTTSNSYRNYNGEEGGLFGGIMHNLSGIKNNEDAETDKEEKSETPEEPEQVIVEENKDSSETETKTETVENEESEKATPLDEESKSDEIEEPEKNEVENSEIEESTKTEEETPSENETTQKLEEDEIQVVDEPLKEETQIQEEVKKPEEDDSEESQIASIVGGFKSNKKGLASGKVIIEKNNQEKNEPKQDEEYKSNDEPFGSQIQTLSANDDADSILNSFRNSTGYENYQNYGTMNDMYNQPYGSPNYNQGYDQAGYGYQTGGYVDPSQNFGTQPYYGNQNLNSSYNSYDVNFGGQFAGNNQNMYNQDFNAYDNYNNSVQEDVSNEVVESYDEPKAKTAQKKVKVQKEEPKKEANKKSVSKKSEEKPKKKEVSKVEEATATKTRGRPKNQVVDETLEIKDDKQFNEVLSRAEKLMRKSEEGLSQSQSKRIEKELKILMDAMNKYRGK